MIFILPDGETPVIGNGLVTVSAAPEPTTARQYGDFADRGRLISFNQWWPIFNAIGLGKTSVFTRNGIYPFPFSVGSHISGGEIISRDDAGIPHKEGSLALQEFNQNDVPVEMNITIWRQNNKMIKVNAKQFMTALENAERMGMVEPFLEAQFSYNR